MEEFARWLGFAAGIVLFGYGLGGLLLVGFGRRRIALARAAERAVAVAFDAVEHRVSPSGVSALRGPSVATAGMLVVPVLLVGALAFLLLPWTEPTLLEALRAAGAAFFGLGLLPDGATPTGIAVLGGASGLLFVVFAVAFVSRIHRAVDRRREVVESIGRYAGSPPWGPELLAGLCRNSEREFAAGFFRRAHEWTFVLGPAGWRDLLGEFRREGPDPVITLLALLDAAALHVVVHPGVARGDALAIVEAGSTAMTGIARDLGLAAAPIRTAMLTEDAFADGLARLREAGALDQACPSDAWERFVPLRRAYAPFAVGIARRVGSAPAPWCGDRPERRG